MATAGFNKCSEDLVRILDNEEFGCITRLFAFLLFVFFLYILCLVCCSCTVVFRSMSMIIVIYTFDFFGIRARDFWEGYKLYCYAYYSHCDTSKGLFQDCKMGEYIAFVLLWEIVHVCNLKASISSTVVAESKVVLL